MDGSLFFRALVWVFDFVKRLCGGSFIAGFFVGDDAHQEQKLKGSIFAKAADKLLNGLPKPFVSPEEWPRWLSNLCRGSFAINTVADGADVPIPQPGANAGFNSLLQWALFALPSLGLLMVVFAAPLLPTMALAGALVIVLVFALLSRRFVVDNQAVFLLVFIGLNIFIGFISLTPGSSIRVAALISVFMSSLLLVVACCKTRRSVDFMFFAFLMGAACTGVWGFYQWVAGYGSGIWLDQELFAGQSRVSSTFGNPNVFGTYLLLAIPLAGACVIYAKKPFYKLCAMGITGLLVVNLLLTLSRGCYLSLALAAGVFVLIIEKRLIVAFIPALLALPFVLPATVVARLVSIVNLQDTSTEFRLFIWQGSLRILGDFWMIGLGQGIEAYNVVYPYYAFAAIVSPHTHNLFMQVFVELGIVGLVVFIGVLACFFRVMANFLRRSTNFGDKVIAAAMVAAVIGFLFQGIFDYVFYNYRVQLVFYIFLGLGIAFAISRGQARDNADETNLLDPRPNFTEGDVS